MSELNNEGEKPAEEKPPEEKTEDFEDDGEDIPDTFFDDFQDQDFMDGLNVVDDWQDEDEEGNSENVNNGDNSADIKKLEDVSPENSKKEELPTENFTTEELSPGNFKMEEPSPDNLKLDDLSPENEKKEENLENMNQKMQTSEDLKKKQPVPQSEEKQVEKSRTEKLERRDDRRGGYPRHYSRERRRSYSRERRRSHSKGRRSRSRHRYDYPPSGRRRQPSRSRDNIRRSRSRDKTRHSRSGDNTRRSRSPRRADVSGRRDPEKTKRDIQRDKIRCAKDHEARVFQEQIKIAESGLCPPGTELDVVLSSERFMKQEVLKADIPVETKPPHESREKIDRIERKEKKEQHIVLLKSPNRSLRRSPHSSSLRRRKSNHRTLSREKSYSPKRRRRSISSRERDREREKKYRDRFHDIPETDLRYRIREKREVRQLMEFPISPPAYVTSPGSEISEREAWLRNREQYRKRHKRLAFISTLHIYFQF